ncbi:MAG: ROK family transcriptional regulator [Flavisolibacter sp.]
MAPIHSIFEVFAAEKATGVALKNKAYKRSIIDLLDQGGNSTIPDLAQALNISTPKTTSLVNDLIQDGLIRDYGKMDSTGGRRANEYGLVAESCFFIGVDIKHDFINIGLMDFKKGLVSLKMKEPYILENTRASFHALMEIIRTFISELTVEKNAILSLCINLSGRINTEKGYSYSFFHFEEEPLSRVIEKELGIRTFLENDTRAMAYGEFYNGIVQHEKNVLFINLDYGVGLGIFIEEQLYYGKSGFGGELGHIPLFQNEIICHCGKKGCLETEASGQALIRLFKEKMTQGSTSSVSIKDGSPDTIRLSDIIDATLNEDMLCIELVEELGEKIGKALAVLINIFNPELVILGGTLMETGDYLRLPIRSALNKYSLSLVNSDTQLRVSMLGEKAGVVGGCLLARNRLLSMK